MRGEFASISAIRALLPPPPDSVGIWIGDDMASVSLPPWGGAGPGAGPGWLLLAADTVVAGVHADLTLTGLDDLGWKSMAACLSDVAAMGGDPGHALVTVAAPVDTDLPLLYEGVAAAAREFGCPVVGGDLTNAHDVVVTVAVTGYCADPPVTRAGARPGDAIWVTGLLGAAAAGLRLLREDRETPTGAASGDDGLSAIRAHTRPRPLLAAGRAARAAGATAMIDVSDGLTADLDHMAVASGVGLRLDTVPVHPAATEAEALGGGEDFALAFCAADSARVEGTFSGLEAPILIGRCTEDPAERTLRGRPFQPAGWEHAWSAAGAEVGPRRPGGGR